MDEYILDPDRFLIAAALVDWTLLAHRDPVHANIYGGAPAKFAASQPHHRVVQLRWLLAPQLGYPTAPFDVWRRPAMNFALEQPLPVDEPSSIFRTMFNWTAYAAPQPMVYIRADVNVTAPQSIVMAFAAAPFGSPVVGIETVSSGFQTVSFSGPQISTLVVFDGAQLQSWVGIDGAAASQGDWTLIERVGLPVDQQAWAGVFDLTANQGAPTAPAPPVQAALQRFARGASPFGWLSLIAPGRLAPPWRQADPHAFLQTMREDVLDHLRQMVATLPPNQHETLRRSLQLAAPGLGEPATADFSVLRSLMFAAATDPVFSLLAGFGTAVDEIDLPPIQVKDITQWGDPTRSDSDFRVTATFARGLDGASDTVKYAALALSPKRLGAPPPPANLAVVQEGRRAPAWTDGPWRPINRVEWDRLPSGLPLRAASYSFARADGAAPMARALILPRKHDLALHPIGATSGDDTASTLGKLRASDDSFEIPGSPPTFPLLYSAAHQDIFGVWSAWRSASINVAEPPVQLVPIFSATLQATATVGPCPAELTLDFAWDWAARSPDVIRFAGFLYGQNTRGAAPASSPGPTGLQKAFPGAPVLPFEVRFAPDGGATVDAGGVILHLSADGKEILAGPLAVAGARRYRLRISGFSLDYAAAPHIGLAISAMAAERRAPGRAGDWSQYKIASTSDPRPPVIAVEQENVLLTSMADAAGEHHALLTWPAASAAVGYFVYTAQEGKLLADCGLPAPNLELTLSQRLSRLRDAFAANPAKRFFTRLNETKIPANRFQILLPRGTREIHLFLIIGVSAGGVESAWPDASDPLLRKRPIAYAAPFKLTPDAPTLDVRRVPDSSIGPDAFRADLALSTLPGVLVERIDIHRVRNEAAALVLDDMGPPVFTLAPGAPGWAISPAPAEGRAPGQPLGRLAGPDRPPGGWKPFYYRAVAWSPSRPERGIVGGRSEPSGVRSVIVPPNGSPDLEPLMLSWVGGDPNLVEIASKTAAPVAPTPLGPHRLRIEVSGRDGAGASLQPLAWPGADPPPSPKPRDSSLVALPIAAPAGDSGAWRAADGEATRIIARVRRPDTSAVLRVRFQLDDPLGRMQERVIEVAAGAPVLPLQFGPATVEKIADQQFIVTTTINLKLTPPGTGYHLSATFNGKLLGLPLPATISAFVRTAEIDYLDIPIQAPTDDPFASADRLPVGREPIDLAWTRLRFYIRCQSGELRARMTGPGGAQADLVKEVP